MRAVPYLTWSYSYRLSICCLRSFQQTLWGRSLITPTSSDSFVFRRGRGIGSYFYRRRETSFTSLPLLVPDNLRNGCGSRDRKASHALQHPLVPLGEPVQRQRDPGRHGSEPHGDGDSGWSRWQDASDHASAPRDLPAQLPAHHGRAERQVPRQPGPALDRLRQHRGEGPDHAVRRRPAHSDGVQHHHRAGRPGHRQRRPQADLDDAGQEHPDRRPRHPVHDHSHRHGAEGRRPGAGQGQGHGQQVASSSQEDHGQGPVPRSEYRLGAHGPDPLRLQLRDLLVQQDEHGRPDDLRRRLRDRHPRQGLRHARSLRGRLRLRRRPGRRRQRSQERRDLAEVLRGQRSPHPRRQPALHHSAGDPDLDRHHFDPVLPDQLREDGQQGLQLGRELPEQPLALADPRDQRELERADQEGQDPGHRDPDHPEDHRRPGEDAWSDRQLGLRRGPSGGHRAGPPARGRRCDQPAVLRRLPRDRQLERWPAARLRPQVVVFESWSSQGDQSRVVRN